MVSSRLLVWVTVSLSLAYSDTSSRWLVKNGPLTYLLTPDPQDKAVYCIILLIIISLILISLCNLFCAFAFLSSPVVCLCDTPGVVRLSFPVTLIVDLCMVSSRLLVWVTVSLSLAYSDTSSRWLVKNGPLTYLLTPDPQDKAVYCIILLIIISLILISLCNLFCAFAFFSSPVVCLCDTPGVVRRPSSVSSLATKLLEI